MAAQRIGGKLVFKIDGAQYSARGAFEYSPFLSEKTGVAGQDGVHGFTEKPVVPFIKGDISDLGGVSVQQLNSISDSTITLELDNGKTIVLSDAWVKGQISVNTEDGKYPAEFEGMDINELLSN